ncbi:MAG: leucine-rich repeat domain-containing protein, partial [Elioraea tepidiphila]
MARVALVTGGTRGIGLMIARGLLAAGAEIAHAPEFDYVIINEHFDRALADLTAMQSLYLTDNKIGNVEPVAKMEKLASLYLGKNQIADLKPLA